MSETGHRSMDYCILGTRLDSQDERQGSKKEWGIRAVLKGLSPKPSAIA